MTAASPERATVARATVERAAVDGAIRAMWRAGLVDASSVGRLEVQPAPSPPGRGVGLVLSLLAIALAGLLMAVRPVSGALLIIASLASLLTELRGEIGWLRALMPRRLRHSLVLWPQTVSAGRTQAGKARLLLVAALADHDAAPGPAARVLLRVAGQTAGQPTANIELVFAFLGGGAQGLTVLLDNHARALGAARVLVLEPGPAAMLAVEGRPRPRDADPLILGAGRALSLPSQRGVSMAAAALARGWRAAGLRLGEGDDALLNRLIRTLDRAAVEEKW